MKKGNVNDSAEVFSNIPVLESRPSTSAASNKSNQSEDEDQDCLSFISDASYSSIFYPTPMKVQQQNSFLNLLLQQQVIRRMNWICKLQGFFFSKYTIQRSRKS